MCKFHKPLCILHHMYCVEIMKASWIIHYSKQVAVENLLFKYHKPAAFKIDFMGLCAYNRISLCNKRGVSRCLSSVCWEQSHRPTYGVFWPLTRRGSCRFISTQVVHHKTLIHNARYSQQRWGRNCQTPKWYGRCKGRKGVENNRLFTGHLTWE